MTSILASDSHASGLCSEYVARRGAEGCPVMAQSGHLPTSDLGGNDGPFPLNITLSLLRISAVIPSTKVSDAIF
jgi:hypothetical protein